jgi:hypothetical protein
MQIEYYCMEDIIMLENEESINLLMEQKQLMREVLGEWQDFGNLKPRDENFIRCNMGLTKRAFELIDSNKPFVKDLEAERDYYKRQAEEKLTYNLEYPEPYSEGPLFTREESPILEIINESGWYEDLLKDQGEYTKYEDWKRNLQEQVE